MTRWLFALVLVLGPVGVAAASGEPPLRPARGYSWLCAGADPRSCPSGAVPRALRRPLHVPVLAAGDPCPAAPGRRVSSQFGLASGPGPASPVPIDRDGVLHFDHGRAEGGWIYVKVLWVVAPSYRGPVLIRGRRLDRPARFGFDRGAVPLAELQLPPLRARLPRRWRDVPSYTRIREAGCYAYQIDGTSFSRTIVFLAAP